MNYNIVFENPVSGESKTAYAVYTKVNGEIKMIGHCYSSEIILPESDNDHSINVNFEGDSEDILNHIEHPDRINHGHAHSMTGMIDIHYVDPEIEQFFLELKDEIDRQKSDLEDFFVHIGRQLIQPAIIELQQSLRNMHWYSPRTHINPYSKKISKIKVKGLGRNKGRDSAQYFSLKSTRKQNTSSVR